MAGRMMKMLHGMAEWCLILAFVFVPVLSCSEGIDLSGMDYDQLCALEQAVVKELQSRPEYGPMILTMGSYDVGREIKPGRYYMMAGVPLGPSESVYLYVYPSSGGSRNSKEYRLHNSLQSIELTEGDTVIVDSRKLALCISEFSLGDIYDYTPPEGTYVPAGLYTAGIDIPADTYRVYAGTVNGGRVLTYKDVSEASKGAFHADVVINIPASNTDDRFEMLVLEDGIVVSVEGDVVMRKQAKLEFD